MSEENTTARISVRNLVEFILRSGDIDNTKSTADADAMQEGTRIHKKIQKSMPGNYKAEVPLEKEVVLQKDDSELAIMLKIDGRADGIFELNQDVIIDEIKSTYSSLERMEEPVPVHLAQAKCYAYFYAEKEGIDHISVQMTYCNIETEAIKRFMYPFTTAELMTWFDSVVKEYSKWLFWEADWKKERDASIKTLEFPFPYRNGQREFVGNVYKTISRSRKIFVEAPTGVGKTISTVFPAVWSVGEGKSSRIFYLTAKTIARTVAEDTFALLNEKGLKFRYVTITAKEKICILDEPACNPVDCPRACGHFDRVNDAVFDMLTHEEMVNRDLISQYAEKHCVCPFEMCLDVTLWSDAIICDYNYAFDPRASLKRFFAEEKKNDYIFLIDEAHNLLERAREMYSAELIKEDFLTVKKYIGARSKKVVSQLTSCNNGMLTLKRECDDFQVWDNADDLYNRLLRAASVFENFFDEDHEGFDGKTEALTLYFDIRRFLEVYENLDDSYRIYTDYTPSGDFRIKLLCMEPASQLKKRMDNTRSSVLFSATLLPMNYYKEQLGGAEDDYAIYAPSPFSKDRRLIMLGTDVSTRYTRRSEGEYTKIARYVEEFVTARKGNYLVFFTSYKMMEDVLANSPKLQEWNCTDAQNENLGEKTLCEINGTQIDDANFGLDKSDEKSSEDITLIVQKRNMTEKEKEDFLLKFSKEPRSTLVGFTVLGGIFSEGIDLTGDRLSGAIIVGCGLPTVGNEKELFKFYFDEKGKDGFDYAYLFPGMNKVMQAAGRVIRTASDYGTVLLLDDRFAKKQYVDLFPEEWFPYEIVQCNNIKGKIRSFYAKIEGSEPLL